MLNITKRISLSKTSKKKIRSFKSSKGNAFSESSWNSISRFVKNEISRKLLAAHSPRCVYCEDYMTKGNQIDHFAPKARYPQFTFVTTNLFYACTNCNSSLRKGQKPTIADPVESFYRNNAFLIVHPYFNDPSVEIFYKDSEQVDYDWDRCTELGKATITFFNWNDDLSTLNRSITALHRRKFPLTNEIERMIIKEIISYKAK